MNKQNFLLEFRIRSYHPVSYKMMHLILEKNLNRIKFPVLQ